MKKVIVTFVFLVALSLVSVSCKDKKKEVDANTDAAIELQKDMEDAAKKDVENVEQTNQLEQAVDDSINNNTSNKSESLQNEIIDDVKGLVNDINKETTKKEKE